MSLLGTLLVGFDACTIDWHGMVCSSGKIPLMASGLWVLARMPMLQNLLSLNNKLEGVLPRASVSMTWLQHLDLSNNRFVGSIPAELARFSISSNGFGGALPLGFRDLRKLKYLDLHGNTFIGKSDDIFAQLQTTVSVDFSCNQFLGSLASSISDNSSVASALQYLNGSHNLLSFTSWMFLMQDTVTLKG